MVFLIRSILIVIAAFICAAITNNNVAGLSFVASRWLLSSSSNDNISNKEQQQQRFMKCPLLTMRVQRGRSKVNGIKGSTVAQVNYERTSTAGKRGRKNFKDPNKVFVGNLPYNATEEDLSKWLNDEQGMPTNYMVKSIKIVREWRNNTSKGYGFIQFMNPIYATSAIVSLKNKLFHGRIIRLTQGVKKRDPATIYIKNTTSTAPKDEEEEVIFEAIDYDDDEDDIEDDEEFHLDDTENAVEFDYDDDTYDDYDDGEEKEDEEEDEDTTVASNRAIRRKAERGMGKKKPLFQGFGDL